MKRLFLFLTILGVQTYGYAQQDAQLSMYMFNLLHFNPAYAGSKECLSVVGVYRHQWDNIQGAPRTVSLSVHNKFKKDHYNWGLSFKGDKLGLTTAGNLEGIFAYKVRMSDEIRLHLGISAGVAFIQRQTQDAIVSQFGDPIQNNNPNKLAPNIGFGAFLYGDKFFVGGAIPHLLLVSYKENEFLAGDSSGQFNHLFFQGGLILGNTDKFKFRPSTMIKYASNAPLSVDVNLSALFSERFWIGASYRFGGNIYSIDNNTAVRQIGSGNAIVGTIKFLITQQLEIGYAYDYPLHSLISRGSHEMMLGFNLCKGKTVRFVTPRYVNYF